MVFQNDILAGASGSIPTYQIDQSLRLGAASSQYLSRTFAADDGDTWTLSMWLKRGALSRGTNQCIYGVTGYSTGHLFLNSSELMQVNDDGAYAYNSTQVFRDPTAWSHYLFRSNGSASSAFYNGELITFPSAYNLNQYNRNVLHYLFRAAAPHYFDGYAAEVAFVSDQYLAYTDFTEFSTDGPLVPKALSDIDFSSGTNSYYLKFENSGDLGEDSSGNNNDWTVNNSPVQVTDTPTDNYATWNAVDKGNVTLSDGNLDPVLGADWQGVRSTFSIPTTGKWYWEITNTTLGYIQYIGLCDSNKTITSFNNGSTANRGWGYGSWFTTYNGNVTKYQSDVVSSSGTNWTGATNPTNGDILMVAYDADNGSLWFGKEGTWFDSSGTANPATNTDPRFSSLNDGTEWFACWSASNTYAPRAKANFGQLGFAHTPPTGFSALSTANLPAPTIADGSTAFQTTLYTGDGNQTQTLTQGGNSTFNPDFIWIKNRSNAYSHNLNDAVRGYTGASPANAAAVKVLAADATDLEGLGDTITTAIQRGFVQSSTANGFIVNKGTSGSQDGFYTNASGHTYAAWQWLAANGTASNGNGSIASTVSANTAAGFSIVSYTGNATGGATIGHGLSQAPEMVITKSLDNGTGRNWAVYHVVPGPTKYAELDGSNPFYTGSTRWNDTAPSSTVVTLGSQQTTNDNGSAMIAFCWHSVEGFSRFGGYTGNGSANGPFIHTGFRPAFVIFKRSNSADNWAMYDATRDPYNVAGKYLYGDTNAAETTYSTAKVDFLSNGFKWRGAVNFGNASGGTYIYMAFAEHPFGGEDVAPATAR